MRAVDRCTVASTPTCRSRCRGLKNCAMTCPSSRSRLSNVFPHTKMSTIWRGACPCSFVCGVLNSVRLNITQGTSGDRASCSFRARRSKGQKLGANIMEPLSDEKTEHLRRCWAKDMDGHASPLSFCQCPSAGHSPRMKPQLTMTKVHYLSPATHSCSFFNSVFFSLHIVSFPFHF